MSEGFAAQAAEDRNTKRPFGPRVTSADVMSGQMNAAAPLVMDESNIGYDTPNIHDATETAGTRRPKPTKRDRTKPDGSAQTP